MSEGPETGGPRESEGPPAPALCLRESLVDPICEPPVASFDEVDAFVPPPRSIAVTDIARAGEFYERTLGLPAGEEQSDESRIHACGSGTSLHVYESPAHAGRATATLATWYVVDLENVVDELASNGVTFERYDHPALKPTRGHPRAGDGRVAWFRRSRRQHRRDRGRDGAQTSNFPGRRRNTERRVTACSASPSPLTQGERRAD